MKKTLIYIAITLTAFSCAKKEEILPAQKAVVAPAKKPIYTNLTRSYQPFNDRYMTFKFVSNDTVAGQIVDKYTWTIERSAVYSKEETGTFTFYEKAGVPYATGIKIQYSGGIYRYSIDGNQFWAFLYL